MCGRGHVWQGACMVGACMAGGVVHDRDGMHGGGGCVHGRYYEIRSMSGWYPSYWNAFLFSFFFSFRNIQMKTKKANIVTDHQQFVFDSEMLSSKV